MKHDEIRGGVRRNTTKSAGFTLIELVMVIVILGVLAATALPRFVDLSSGARAAVMKDLEGKMRSANAMLYAKAAIQGKVVNGVSNVTINGKSYLLYGGHAYNLDVLVSLLDISDGIESNGYAILHKGAKNPMFCKVLYDVRRSDAQPVYTVETSGC
jgi:MSHA pilin protein MshA